MTNIAIIVGSTRPGRKAAGVARWVADVAAARGDATFEVVDIADYSLPLLDEPAPAAMSSDYRRPHTEPWSEKIASFDGFVFVTPEYNRSTSGAMKNALDYLYVEWNNKAAGFVSYGFLGGTRAVEHLRLTMGELQVAVVRTQVALSLGEFTEDGSFAATAAGHEPLVNEMLDQVIAWADALKVLRPALAVPS